MGEVFGVDVPSIKDASHLYSDKVVGGFYNGEGTLNDEQRASRVTEEFRKSKPGDVIQIYWDTGAGYPVSQHTAIIFTTYETENKVQFLHSHWVGNNIVNTEHTYAKCAECIRDAGTAGGFTIYRFAGAVPEQPAPEQPVPETQAVALDSATIPDDNFRSYLKGLVSGRSMMTAEEVAAIKTIDVRNKGNIASLKGVEYFTALTTLICYNNKITGLDLSKNTALKGVNCSSNSMTYLNADTCSELVTLVCTSIKLKELYAPTTPQRSSTLQSPRTPKQPNRPSPQRTSPPQSSISPTASSYTLPASAQSPSPPKNLLPSPKDSHSLLPACSLELPKSQAVSPSRSKHQAFTDIPQRASS